MIKYNNISEISLAASEFIKNFEGFQVIAFYGEMGAGKTTFIKEICRIMGVTDEVNSPTFSIINEYLTSENELVYHFDFYRLKNISEAYDLGLEEYFFSGNKCFIEWPEKIEDLLPPGHLKIKIIPDGDKRQIITL